MSLKGALTDSRTLPSAPLCSDERRDWIGAPCDDCRVHQSNRGAHRSKAAAVRGSSRSRAALNCAACGSGAVNRSPRVLEAPPDPVSTHTRASWPSVRTPEGRNANRTSGDAPGGSAAPRGTECCRSVTEGARSTPRPSFDPPCSRSAIRSDRARSESDDASWRRSTGSAESASESRVE